MALPVNKGQKVSQYEEILGDLVVNTATDAGCIAGEVYASGPFIVISPITTVKDGSDNNIIPGWVEGHYVVRKHGDTSLHAWVKGDPLIAIAVGSHDYLQFRVAVAGEPIHAYAFKDALTADTEGQIIGPFLPPFSLLPIGDITALLAILAAATGNQIVVADGAGGIELTSFAIPVIDGTANQILKTDGSEVVSWAADAT